MVFIVGKGWEKNILQNTDSPDQVEALKDKTEGLLVEGKNVILEIDVQGGRQVKKSYPEALMIFIMPPSQDDLAKRIEGRARGEDEETAQRRLNASNKEIVAGRDFYDYRVMNDKLERAVEGVINIIEGRTGEQE